MEGSCRVDSAEPVPNAVVYLLLLTLYLMALVGYALKLYDDEGRNGYWSVLWENETSQKNVLGVLPQGVVKPRGDSSRMKRLLNAALRNIHLYQQTHAPLAWEIDPSAMHGNAGTPIVCFVNTKSGGQEGAHVIASLTALLGRAQVFDLAKSDPILVLKELSKLPMCRILACGGDGTANWLLDAVEAVSWTATPPMCILPIGTGNDLANHLGWVQYFNDHAISGAVLQDVLQTPVVRVDRWVVSFAAPAASIAPKVFINYLGLGVDASIVLQFHNLRKRQPHIFVHQFVNKLLYGLLGGRHVLAGDPNIDLLEFFRSQVRVSCDGKDVEIPAGTEGVVFVNIGSYAGGSVLWSPGCASAPGVSLSDEDETHCCGSGPASTDYHGDGPPAAFCQNSFAPQCAGDGLVEVVAVRSSLELAQVKMGLTHCRPLCQGRSVSLQLLRGRQSLLALPIQVDGEPFTVRELAPAADALSVTVQAARAAEMLQAPSARSVLESVIESARRSGTDADSLIAWARNSGTITDEQAALLLDEYNSRLTRFADFATTPP